MTTMLKLTCACCDEPFEKALGEYNRSRNSRRKPGSKWRDFCSPECFRYFVSNKEPVPCSVCGTSVLRSASARESRKAFFCKGCRKSVSVPCSSCGASLTRWASQVRGKKNVYCNRACKARGQRVPWNDLTRGMLKNRWIQEFGKDSLMCSRCGHDRPFNVVIHHKKYRMNGGDNRPKNLEPLCLNCHGIEHYENGPDSEEG